ncbi:terminase [Alloscardovia omnicolens]|uniref:terminase n=1 Tax=Alloscardovia omnicolens TaxID=419015 RepID=UPI00254DA255|nr:terminase [Alloscardovia omnicolens]MDK6445734.1 terminase [Alloscardovia omnicolens]
MAKLYGKTEPRLWSQPLRELTPETSLGFEVIDFAEQILNVHLYPWQKWLLIHALELLDDGITYRFRRIIVLVARQNGKTMLVSVLAAWWLFVDSVRHPDRVPPVKFKIVGCANNLDIAREPWTSVKQWCENEPATLEESELAIPTLQKAMRKIYDANGKELLRAKSMAHYELRAASHARGKPASKVILDELREQKSWDAWNALSSTTLSFWNGQLWGISNAGDANSVVLKTQREAALKALQEWDATVTEGKQTISQYVTKHDTTIGLFEWSAPDECSLTDTEAVLQSNPSIGYSALSVDIVMSQLQGVPESAYRTENLCQWVTADITSYINKTDWDTTMSTPFDIHIPYGARTVWGIDVSSDRSHTWIAAAVLDEDGTPVVNLRECKEGLMWVPDYMEQLAQESGMWEVALQSKGCPAMEFIKPLQDKGLTVHEIDGSHIGIATGRLRDRVREKRLKHTPQPLIDQAIEGGVTKIIAENEAWDRRKSIVDISGIAAITVALYALETCEAPQPQQSAYEQYDIMTF